MTDEVAVGTVLNGRYRLEELLGGGGFGQVFAAVDRSLGRRVAVKVLMLRAEWAEVERSERQGRFRREAVAAAALSHPNVATIHDAGEHQGRPFLVMELLPGTDFRRVLLDRGGLPVPDVIAYGAQICAGLHHAHERGLVHRDIKPENLMLLPDGVVKICDFGLVTHQDSNATRYTEPQALLGSPPYFAPEQAQGGEVTARSDLYSLGCVLYAMLAEGPPFVAGNYIGYAYLHVHEEPEPLVNRRPEVPPELARLVHQLLAKKPADRPSGAAEVAERLRAMMRPAALRRTPTALDRGARHLVWTLIEEGEALLSAGRFHEADDRYWQARQLIVRQGADNEPASFAALFGRARAVEGLNGVLSARRQFEELAEAAAAALGADHPLARCTAAYASVRAAR
ncbi:serine/threonine-protein kinase [Streptomyces sp. NPDC020983]|uniref:serine/threonine-protein kinase n=1 Tax=Streptomyces sp. NPDC020983 TaxID=3365106 RepID=UPI0037902CF0